jgi:hypothetical protein
MLNDVGGVPAVQMGGYGGYDGGGGWLGMLLVIALLGGRGFGFGHDGGHGGGHGGCCHDSCCEKEVRMVHEDLNSRFNNLQNQIDFNANTGFQRELLRSGDQNTFGLSREIGAIGMALQNCCCETQKGLLENRFVNEKNAWTISKQISDCCCETNRSIDAVRIQNERDTCSIIQNASNNTQRIIDWLSCNELKEANARIAALEADKNKLEIIGAMKPVAPVPAYIQANPFENFVPKVHCVPQQNHCQPFNNCGQVAFA